MGALVLLLALAGCGGGDPTPTPSPTGGPPIDSVEAFQNFSGFTIPSSATKVTIQVTSAYEDTAYRARFDLPAADLDAFCQSGQMSRPLRIVTIPGDIRKTFDYKGDGSTGVALGEAGLPSNQRTQRQVFAVGTKTKTLHVQVYTYKLPD
jgi:hypothetical protein